jgi:hypothetical protein
MPRRARPVAPAFEAITTEGALIAPPMLAKIAALEAEGQTDASYRIPKGLTLRDEIARYFHIGQAQFADFAKLDSPSTAKTQAFVEALLREVFGFGDLVSAPSREDGGRTLAVTAQALSGRAPIVVAKSSDDLDRVAVELTLTGRRRSPALALQDWLNASEDALWGLCSNGEHLRLMRENESLTRPAYIEANLKQIFEADGFADFTALWLLIHASRFGPPRAPKTDCALERWREAASKEGLAARDRLRDGVEAALLALANGFLAENSELRAQVVEGRLTLSNYFGELLRLVYRLIFLCVAEDRELLHAPDATVAAKRLYAEGYSLATLREQAVRRSAWDRHSDKWEGLQIVFLSLARGEKRLGLPGLGGLFLPDLTPDLDRARLPNRALMEAIYRLAWLRDDTALTPVNWRDMKTEELGSVYESLLELTPRIADDGRALSFAEGAEALGHTRRTTGSYYTPDSLVQALLDSALDPVLDRAESESDSPDDALLGLRVIDPACGSGHFLLAAAWRVASRVARLRGGGVASATDYRHALRDVARQCLYGVDRNPMAVELTKVALWIETIEPGKPLGFLDANIRCGDAVIGVFDLGALRLGVPDEAYKPLTGDDKEAAKIAGRVNRTQRDAKEQHDLALTQGAAEFVRAARKVAAMPEDDVAAVQARAQAYAGVHADRGWWATKTACDLYVAAFLAPKRFRAGALERARSPDLVPTTLDVRASLAGRPTDHQLVCKAVDLAGKARAFHWPLEFPEAFAAGGFDIVLGNPPWERIKLQEQEFFASRDKEIAEAPNAAARGRLIAVLKAAAMGTRERKLYEEFEAAKRLAEASSVFARVPDDDGGRFPLAGRGDINTYALFAELFSRLSGPDRRAGVIVPTGIATDFTNRFFFQELLRSNRLVSFLMFDNQKRIFPAVHPDTPFGLLALGPHSSKPEFAAYLLEERHLGEPERRFTLTPDQISAINPNTKTAPIFRSRADAELTAKIYARVPVLIDETKGMDGNLWGAKFHTRIWHMAEDSQWFRTATQLRDAGFERDGADWVSHGLRRSSERYVPLYEAKMVHQFDHRWATYAADGRTSRDPTPSEKADQHFEPTPRYWVPETEVADRLAAMGWTRGWLMGWRDITNATNERTLISAQIPAVGSGDKFLLVFPSVEPRLCAALTGAMNSLACDFVVRQKLGGTSLKLYLIQQVPLPPPASYTPAGLAFIAPRILELAYTSHSLAPFALDLGYDGPPFAWDENRRAVLRAELDAFYARAYCLTRDELRYILDPNDVRGPDYPSETFRVLKNNEKARYGEYRTARLVLDAWDRMERGELT